MRANSPLRNLVNATETLTDAAAGTVARGESTIAEMARAYGVTLRTLRFYEDRNLLRSRRVGNARYYRDVHRVRLHPRRDCRPDRRRRRCRQKRIRGAAAAGADRRSAQPSRAPAARNRRGDRAVEGYARTDVARRRGGVKGACKSAPPPDPAAFYVLMRLGRRSAFRPAADSQCGESGMPQRD